MFFEIFHSSNYPGLTLEDGTPAPDGWYYWACFPGCLPDSEPMGAFETKAEAEAAVNLEMAEFTDLDEPGEQPHFS